MKKRNETFIELQAKWYHRLEKEGFVDIERRGGQVINIDFRNASITDHEAVQTYFRIARSFIHTHRFESRKRKSVWILHSEGKSNREIARRLKINRETVNSIIRKHKKIAGLK